MRLYGRSGARFLTAEVDIHEDIAKDGPHVVHGVAAHKELHGEDDVEDLVGPMVAEVRAKARMCVEDEVRMRLSAPLHARAPHPTPLRRLSFPNPSLRPHHVRTHSPLSSIKE